MYEIYLFRGGVYRFDELKEAVEDLGGLVLKKDYFHISRGVSFLAEEVEVMLMVPLQDETIIKSLSSDIKGRLDKLEFEDINISDILGYISVCDALIRSGTWMTIDEIRNYLECPCAGQLCSEQEIEICVLDNLEETLSKFCQEKILKSRKRNGEDEYSLNEHF